MTQDTLSPPAQTIIAAYLGLPLGDKQISVPYFNNKRAKVRGGLRVMIGKGSPDDIIEEAILLAQRDLVDFSELSQKQIKQFLIEKNIGLDCSALIYYALDAEQQYQGKGEIKTTLHFPFAKNPLRKLLIKLRPAENVNVKTLAHQSNSAAIDIADVKAGDIITIVGAGYTGIFDHVMLIHEVEYKKNIPATIQYTHSYQWSTDGKWNHGARQGKIVITDPKASLLEQKWIEQGEEGAKNETLKRAKEAKELHIRRLHSLK